MVSLCKASPFEQAVEHAVKKSRTIYSTVPSLKPAEWREHFLPSKTRLVTLPLSRIYLLNNLDFLDCPPLLGQGSIIYLLLSYLHHSAGNAVLALNQVHGIIALANFGCLCSNVVVLCSRYTPWLAGIHHRNKRKWHCRSRGEHSRQEAHQWTGSKEMPLTQTKGLQCVTLER